MSAGAWADLLAGAIKLGTTVVDALRRAPKALKTKLVRRPRVHVPTEAERALERERRRRERL